MESTASVVFNYWKGKGRKYYSAIKISHSAIKTSQSYQIVQSEKGFSANAVAYILFVINIIL